MHTIDEVLDEIESHPVDEQTMIIEIARKRLIEKKREKLYKAGEEALKEYQEGKVKSVDLDEYFQGLDD